MTEKHDYRDESLSIDDRLTALMSTMTTREKVAQLGAVWANLLVRSSEFAFQREKAKTHLEHGIGQISRLGAVSMLSPIESARLANRIQKFLVDETRLGISAMLHEESCAGYLAKGAMTFPQAIDRASLTLPGVQQKLVQAICATGTPTIVVLLSGRPPVLTEIVDIAPAILQAWLPAQAGGAAIANVLFGKVNPGGKLPLSLPRSVGQAPLFYNHKPAGGRSHWYGEYRDEDTRPLFPFGHGLSYTTFEFSNLSLSAQRATADKVIQVRFDLKNS